MHYFYDKTGYDFLEDAYSGGGGFKDGRYLIPHPREDYEKLLNRKELAYYSNFVKPVVDSLTNPIFRKPIARDWEGQSHYLSSFLEDVDKLGSSMNRFMKKATRLARLHGSIFIVVDNTAELDKTVAEAKQKRAFPYLYMIKPNQVLEYQCDRFGVLASITYEVSNAYNKSFGGVNINNDVETWTWDKNNWECKKGDTVVAGGTNELGIVPIIPFLGVDAEIGDLLPTSPMLSIARTNLQIYNLCSELREILRNQAFAVLCYPITEKVSIDKAQNGIRIGTDTLLPFDGETKSIPCFIAPSAEPATLIQTEIARLIEDIYRQANLTSVVSVQTKTSGVAKQWDFEQTNQNLSDMAEMCELVERGIIKLFALRTASTINYKVVYPRDFGIVDVRAELDKVAAALDLNVGNEFNKEVKIKAVDTYLTSISDDRYDEIITDIQNDIDDLKFTKSEDDS